MNIIGATGIPTRTGTSYTGNTIQGEAVISQLDVGDLEPGTTCERAG